MPDLICGDTTSSPTMEWICARAPHGPDLDPGDGVADLRSHYYVRRYPNVEE